MLHLRCSNALLENREHVECVMKRFITLRSTDQDRLFYSCNLLDLSCVLHINVTLESLCVLLIIVA